MEWGRWSDGSSSINFPANLSFFDAGIGLYEDLVKLTQLKAHI